MSASPPQVSGEITFTGEGREYFRVWIVNLALSVATLGVYSAWAKVRRLQFFYRHTRLDGASFDFHGQPLAILKGRIVALGLFGLRWSHAVRVHLHTSRDRRAPGAPARPIT